MFAGTRGRRGRNPEARQHTLGDSFAGSGYVSRFTHFTHRRLRRQFTFNVERVKSTWDHGRDLLHGKVYAVFIAWLLKYAIYRTISCTLLDESMPSEWVWQFVMYLGLVLIGATLQVIVEGTKLVGEEPKEPLVAAVNFMPAWALKACVADLVSESMAAFSFDYFRNALLHFSILLLVFVAAWLVRIAFEVAELYVQEDGFLDTIFDMIELSLALSCAWAFDDFIVQGLFTNTQTKSIPILATYAMLATTMGVLLIRRTNRWKDEHAADATIAAVEAIGLVEACVVFEAAWAWDHVIEKVFPENGFQRAAEVTLLGVVLMILVHLAKKASKIETDMSLGVVGLNMAWAWTDYVAHWGILAEMGLLPVWGVVLSACALSVFVAWTEDVAERNWLPS